MKIRDLLQEKLDEKEISALKTGFDTVGSIAIIEIPPGLVKKEGLIAEALMKIHHNITTVAKKVGIHSGEFRLQKLKVIAGKKTKETEYKENNVRLLLNVEKVYFSPRLSTERKRISDLVKRGESVLVMFSGCGPYVCVIAKNTQAREVYGIEINPIAHRYAEKNIALNKIINAKVFLGDVRKVVPRLKKRFDRVLMPLPKSAEDFLGVALKVIKKKGIVHFYDFEHEDDLPGKAVEKIEKACRKARKKFKVVGWRKCGMYGPRKYRAVVDFRVL
ncbi:SAM-dependent methyltransferase [Candidatus Woesearchaeota archaeon CG10_big_fil_rev_8_21_14_0_10_44_13]|nr:MAG: SAM-dependent methyltransferase [Candidatus Woesearchaeota archaeon CG10_big_fil_rev_8_21_14_0_10_44_13]